jgi:hypothetical protein
LILSGLLVGEMKIEQVRYLYDFYKDNQLSVKKGKMFEVVFMAFSTYPFQSSQKGILRDFCCPHLPE